MHCYRLPKASGRSGFRLLSPAFPRCSPVSVHCTIATALAIVFATLYDLKNLQSAPTPTLTGSPRGRRQQTQTTKENATKLAAHSWWGSTSCIIHVPRETDQSHIKHKECSTKMFSNLIGWFFCGKMHKQVCACYIVNVT